MMSALRNVENPTLPYSLPIRLPPGHMVHIEGRVPKDSEGFALNLWSRDAVALHVNVRFGADARPGAPCLLALNSMAGGTWGEEAQRAGLPLVRDVDFQLSVAIDEDGYEVVCNDSSSEHYAHRLAEHCVDRLVINPTVYIFRLRILAQFDDNTMKYGAKIAGGLFPGKTIIIDGTVPAMAKRFALNLLQSRGGNIALQVNPRFDDEEEGEVVVRNSRINGVWGDEERHSLVPFPFARGQAFVLEVHCHKEYFVVKVNYSVAFTFIHRITPLESITRFFIYGDVVIY